VVVDKAMVISDMHSISDTEIKSELMPDNESESSNTNNDIEVAKQKLREFVKEVAITPLTDEQTSKFQDAITSLKLLQDDVIAKGDDILAKRDLVQQKLEILKQSKEVTINDDEFKDSDARVNQFMQLLKKMIAEIERDIIYYNSLISSTPPDYVLVLKTATDSFEDYIQQRIVSVRMYAKKANRDLAIGYSRFCLKFDAQLKQIAYVESILKHREHEEHSASQK